MPFARTPLKVMETTAIDYTLFGLIKSRIRDAFINGDAATRGEIAARYTLSIGVMTAAYNLAVNGIVVGQDGGWNSTARRERPSYSIKIGGEYHDIARLDPFGTILGIAADAYYASTMDLAVSDEFGQERDEGWEDKVANIATEAMFWPLMQNIFNKAMLDSLDSFMQISQAKDPAGMDSAFERFLTSQATRFVPASGVQRQLDKWDDGMFRTARGFTDGLLKSSVGADKLPPRLDHLFGRPVEMPLGEQLIGWKGGPGLADEVDKELARLAFQLDPPDRKMGGVTLTQVEYNRYLELRGHEIKLGGQTLEEAISGLIQSPDWDRTPDTLKVETIKNTLSPYSRMAKEYLKEENDDFHYRSIGQKMRDDYEMLGRTRSEADADTRRLAEQLGLEVNY